MNPYVIFTDSGSDITLDVLAEWGVRSQSLSFRFDGSEKEYVSGDMPEKEFYDHMRDGKVARTAAVNAEDFRRRFEEELKKGNDVLYLGFSSGLSTTFNSGRLAAEELSEAYPDRKVIAVDTLAASAGQGLLVYYAVQKKNEGATIEETAAYIESIKLNLCHWFTVDDLVYLKRGGRVSPAVALVGGMLQIKPVMHVDNEGHLVKVTTARGRKNSLKALADKFKDTVIDPTAPVFISHGDCIHDIDDLVEMIKERGATDVRFVTYVGSVIGAHSGPGTVALFFLGSER